MNEKVDIYKAAAVIIRDRKILVSRSKNKDVFVAPGGKLDPGESHEAALIRELNEEQGIVVSPDDLTPFGTFYAIAAGHEAAELQLEMKVFIVNAFQGELTPQAEIAENKWVNSSWSTFGINLGSIFAHDVIPALQARGLID